MRDLHFDVELDDDYVGSGELAVRVRIRSGHQRVHSEDTIIHPDSLFASYLTPGRYPILNCDCGDFGCGGAAAEITHSDSAWCLLLENGGDEFSFGWQHVIATSQQLVNDLHHLARSNGGQVYIVGGDHEFAPLAEYAAAIETLHAMRG